MKKSIVIIAGLLILAWAMGGRPLPFLGKQEELAATSPPTVVDQIEQKFAATKHSPNEEPQKAPEQEESSMAPFNLISPASFFPDAKVISSVWIDGKRPDEKILIKTVETDMKYSFVRVEEVYKGSGADRSLIDQAAMIANQVLIQRPDDISDENFLAGLRAAGAIESKPMQSAFLVTFEAKPEDPQALESYVARLRQVLGKEIVIEPNYVRKI